MSLPALYCDCVVLCYCTVCCATVLLVAAVKLKDLHCSNSIKASTLSEVQSSDLFVSLLN
jgi:hypothetical protein